MKKVEKDAEKHLPLRYIKKAKRDSKAIDLFIANTSFMKDLYFSSFWYDGNVAQIGYPRYEVFFRDMTLLKKKVINQLSIPPKKKIVLYAPTFRKTNAVDVYNLDYEQILRAFNKRFSEDFILLLRLHPEISFLSHTMQYKADNVINVSDYPDIQELLLCADCLITDYSSLYLDFCFTGKPIFRYASDVEEFCADRDLYFPIESYPFPLSKNNEEMVQTILNYDEKIYFEKVDAFINKIGLYNPQGASQKCASLINSYINTRISKKDLFKKYKEELKLISKKEWLTENGGIE